MGLEPLGWPSAIGSRLSNHCQFCLHIHFYDCLKRSSDISSDEMIFTFFLVFAAPVVDCCCLCGVPQP